MIESLKTEGRKYSLIYFKDKIDRDKEIQKQMQIDKIKNVFIDNEESSNICNQNVINIFI